jgi:hypothetical protein
MGREHGHSDSGLPSHGLGFGLLVSIRNRLPPPSTAKDLAAPISTRRETLEVAMGEDLLAQGVTVTGCAARRANAAAPLPDHRTAKAVQTEGDPRPPRFLHPPRLPTLPIRAARFRPGGRAG